MLKMFSVLRILLCFLTTIYFVHAVDFDYYYGALRSKKVCRNLTEKVNCQIKCGLDAGLCLGMACYCLTVSRLKKDGAEGSKNTNIVLNSDLLDPNDDDENNNDFYDYNELPDVHHIKLDAYQPQDTPEYLDESLLDDRPALRHHIAHFCPNVDVAKACIRTCMKEGKPAFCGKDHVCYCGHKYSNQDKNAKSDVKGTYSQFRDMYEKYFGPNYKQTLDV